jgi:4-amino-4-deoxy-L-arabinose transferase-like glycosyltransferase
VTSAYRALVLGWVRSVSDGQRQLERYGQLSERERTRIEGRFGMVLLLLIITVFFSISAPDEALAWLATTAILATNLSIAMWASGVRPKVLLIWLGVVILGVSVSILIAITQEAGAAGGYLALTSLLLTLATIGAIARRLWRHAEISVLTVLGALCIYVLFGLSFAYVDEVVGNLGSQPFFASQETATRSDYMYFSFITIASVGYGDLTPQGGLGRALAVTESLFGEIYLVTAVAALVGNMGRARVPRRGSDEEAVEEYERRDGR